MDLLSTLNERQREAVTTTDGPLLILAVTFTSKAAQEMRERVTRLLEGERLTSAPLVSTFHSLCVRMLRRDIEKLEEGYTRSFTIYDQDDSLRVVKACIKDLGYDEELKPRQTQGAISNAKNKGHNAEAYAASAEYIDVKRASIARVFKL